MVDPLSRLLADGVVDEVLARLKSGKEADLWLVRHAGEVVAAKVYKGRQARSFRNRAAYQEGRQVRDTRTQRAMDRGSRFGRAAEEDAWMTKEADALHALHAAGVRVPRPVMFHEGVLLMELVVDEAGHPAPRLVDARVPRDRAAALYADLRGQAIRMLRCDLVHGDLSPYNVLLGRQGPVVIDFPQVIGAAHNTQAEGFFRRDLESLRRFFAALDPALHRAAGDAGEIWRAYVRRELTGDFVPTGRGVEPPRHRPAHGEARHARGRGEPSPDQTRRHPSRPGHRAPAPEVTRVARPPPGPAGTHRHGPARAGAPGGPSPSGTGTSDPAGGPGRRRRRRRRRR
jgi:RIO kinase 1